MERIKANEVQSMMEAYTSVYNTKEKQLISEEVLGTELVLENDEYEKLDENLLQLLTRNRTVYRRDPKTGEKIKVDQQRDPKNLDKYVDKNTSGTGDYGYRKQKPGEPGDGTFGNFVRRKGPQGGGTQQQKPRPQSPSSNLKPGSPNTVVSPKSGEETKFERRLPTSAELRAAQAARKAATAGGASKKEAEYQAVKAGVGISKGTVKDPKIAADASRKAELAAIRAKAKADTMKKKPAASAPAMSGRARMGEELDVFDTIKEHLILEHELSEDVALQLMSILDEETRADIMEYTASMSAGSGGKTVKMTADGKEPVGDRLIKGIGKRIGGLLNRLNPNALRSRTVEPRKPLVQQNNSFEPNGELVDEGSCGSKPKKKKKGGYGK